jgi:hypothetical protein
MLDHPNGRYTSSTCGSPRSVPRIVPTVDAHHVLADLRDLFHYVYGEMQAWTHDYLSVSIHADPSCGTSY